MCAPVCVSVTVVWGLSARTPVSPETRPLGAGGSSRRPRAASRRDSQTSLAKKLPRFQAAADLQLGAFFPSRGLALMRVSPSIQRVLWLLQKRGRGAEDLNLFGVKRLVETSARHLRYVI